MARKPADFAIACRISRALRGRPWGGNHFAIAVGMAGRRVVGSGRSSVASHRACGKSRKHTGFGRELASRPFVDALSGETLVSCKSKELGACRSLVSALWQSISAAELVTHHWRSVDGHRGRLARASLVVPRTRRIGQDWPISRANRPDAQLVEITVEGATTRNPTKPATWQLMTRTPERSFSQPRQF